MLVRPAGDEQGETGGGEEGGADPLHYPRGDQQDGLNRQPARDAGQDKEAQPDAVQRGLAEHVGEATTEQQEAAERNRVPLTNH